jgi:hypothetical protein
VGDAKVAVKARKGMKREECIFFLALWEEPSGYDFRGFD